MQRELLFEPKRDIPRQLQVLAAIVPFITSLAAWCILSYGGYVPRFFLPPPTDIIRAIHDLVMSGGLPTHILVSVYRITCGFLIAAALAVPIGILMGSFRMVQALIEPINDFVRYMPVAAFIPLAILWTGTGDIEKMAIIFIGTYFQLVLLIADNARSVPTEYLEVAYTLGGSKRTAILRVLVPAALPGILDSLRIAIGWAWSYLIVAEIVAANRGLGFMIIQSQRFLKTAEIISGIIIIGLIGLATDFSLRWLSRRLFPWKEET